MESHQDDNTATNSQHNNSRRGSTSSDAATGEAAMTKAGVECLNGMLLNSTQTSNSGGGEDGELLLSNRILQSRSQDDRRARQRAEEELQFVKHKLINAEKKLEVERKAKAEWMAKCANLEKQCGGKESVVGTLKHSNAELHDKCNQLEERYEKLQKLYEQAVKTQEMFSQQLAISTGALSPSAVGAASSSNLKESGSGSFLRRSVAQAIKDKVSIRRLKRTTVEERKWREQVSSGMECALMEEADMHSKIFNRNLEAGIPALNEKVKSNAATTEEDGYDSTGSTGSWGSTGSADGNSNGGDGRAPLRRRHSGGLVSFDAVRRSHRNGQGAYYLPFKEKLDLKAGHDEPYVEAKIKASDFETPFKTMRQDMHEFAQQWKANVDTMLNSLWFIFSDQDKKSGGQAILANPKDDFHKEIKNALFKTKTMLVDFVKKFNTGVKGVLNSENKVKNDYIKKIKPSKDFECQADIPGPEDPRIAPLREQVEYLTTRQVQLKEDFNARSSDLEMNREKAEVNMQFLQEKVWNIHEAVYHALHTVYKHRYHFASRCPNHFGQVDRNVSKKRQLEVQYNVQLAEAIDLDVIILGKFADYFVSDDLFGVDLAGSKDTDPIPTSLTSAASGNNNSKYSSAAGVMANYTSKVASGENTEPTSQLLRKKEAVPSQKESLAAYHQAHKLQRKTSSSSSTTTTTAPAAPAKEVSSARKLNTQLEVMMKKEREEKAATPPPPAQSPRDSTPTAIHQVLPPAPSSGRTDKEGSKNSRVKSLPVSSTLDSSSSATKKKVVRAPSPPTTNTTLNTSNSLRDEFMPSNGFGQMTRSTSGGGGDHDDDDDDNDEVAENAAAATLHFQGGPTPPSDPLGSTATYVDVSSEGGQQHQQQEAGSSKKQSSSSLSSAHFSYASSPFSAITSMVAAAAENRKKKQQHAAARVSPTYKDATSKSPPLPSGYSPVDPSLEVKGGGGAKVPATTTTSSATRSGKTTPSNPSSLPPPPPQAPSLATVSSSAVNSAANNGERGYYYQYQPSGSPAVCTPTTINIEFDVSYKDGENPASATTPSGTTTTGPGGFPRVKPAARRPFAALR